MDSDEAAQAAKDGPALASEALVAVLVLVALLVAVPAGARWVATALGLELGLVVPVPVLVSAAVLALALALAFAVARLWAGRARALGLALAAVGPGTGPRSLSGPWNHLRALCILPSYRHQTEGDRGDRDGVEESGSEVDVRFVGPDKPKAGRKQSKTADSENGTRRHKPKIGR
ncbi:hypothetical protein M440DRAFT_4071 [Trichoderma longibrachiatum ATCC 18648]|uniref:Uncharacterized protein n=1 Tax=Trichoderma longibrachiatum ATCC 18648 TaxID=983965 RepID=A0A2T4C8Q3_TRILO|nr:hypothetical protein M440DRAFT_4071 [Trichoderma longibrachiatum ATCC 18648]